MPPRHDDDVGEMCYRVFSELLGDIPNNNLIRLRQPRLRRKIRSIVNDGDVKIEPIADVTECLPDMSRARDEQSGTRLQRLQKNGHRPVRRPKHTCPVLFKNSAALAFHRCFQRRVPQRADTLAVSSEKHLHPNLHTGLLALHHRRAD